ncbi:MAG: iron-sulfur cluster biosynthesis family protein [Lactobacillus sp.]|jgi:uncharacterized protein YqkB|nr:iron-sulfur cluster biosynthesis family protein [Lactobacillus sp.]MCI2032883.1 iron-sulfur cluster biosynthesis family protein [Lactobacillus sp.]
MAINFDAAAVSKLTPHLAPDKRLLLTFEDGVGPYSQHAMIHMQVQFTLNVIAADAPAEDYDVDIPSNLGPIGIKGYSQEDLDPHLSLRYDSEMGIFTLSGDGGEIDGNVGFIDFTES